MISNHLSNNLTEKKPAEAHHLLLSRSPQQQVMEDIDLLIFVFKFLHPIKSTNQWSTFARSAQKIIIEKILAKNEEWSTQILEKRIRYTLKMFNWQATCNEDLSFEAKRDLNNTHTLINGLLEKAQSTAVCQWYREFTALLLSSWILTLIITDSKRPRNNDEVDFFCNEFLYPPYYVESILGLLEEEKEGKPARVIIGNAVLDREIPFPPRVTLQKGRLCAYANGEATQRIKLRDNRYTPYGDQYDQVHRQLEFLFMHFKKPIDNPPPAYNDSNNGKSSYRSTNLGGRC